MKNPAATAYREMHIRGSSVLGLTVMLHEAAVRSLREARAAIASGDAEARTRAINHTLAVIGELHSSLDLSVGEVAQRLERFYVVMRGQVLEAGMKSSDSMLRRLEEEFVQQRDAWVKVQQEVERAAALRQVPSPTKPPGAAAPAPPPENRPPLHVPVAPAQLEPAGASWRA